MGKLPSDGYKMRSIGYSRGPEHTNATLVPMMMSGKARYEEGAVYCDVEEPSTTLFALTTANENPDNTMPLCIV